MKKHERVILCLVFAQVILFFVLHRVHLQAKSAVVKPAEPINVLPATLIGDETQLLGNVHGMYTLVEFGDYQCPPCAQMSVQVKSLLTEHPYELRFRFRHYPLPMHHYSMDCALIGEEARALGHFWEVHDRLYDLKTQVSPDQVTKALTPLKLDFTRLSDRQKNEARKRVQDDIKLADSCSLDATPTFLLCCPDGRVLKLGALSQVETLLN